MEKYGIGARPRAAAAAAAAAEAPAEGETREAPAREGREVGLRRLRKNEVPGLLAARWAALPFFLGWEVERPSTSHASEESQSAPEAPADGALHRRPGAILALKLERLGGMERGLGHEARSGATMRLGRVDQEGMAEIDRAGLTGGERDGMIRRRVEPLRHFEKQQHPAHPPVRAAGPHPDGSPPGCGWARRPGPRPRRGRASAGRGLARPHSPARRGMRSGLLPGSWRRRAIRHPLEHPGSGNGWGTCRDRREGASAHAPPTDRRPREAEGWSPHGGTAPAPGIPGERQAASRWTGYPVRIPWHAIGTHGTRPPEPAERRDRGGRSPPR